MSGALKAAWALTAFVILAGVVLWLVTGRAVFAAFVVLGLLTAVGAAVTGRSAAPGRAAPGPAEPGPTPRKEERP